MNWQNDQEFNDWLKLKGYSEAEYGIVHPDLLPAIDVVYGSWIEGRRRLWNYVKVYGAPWEDAGRKMWSEITETSADCASPESLTYLVSALLDAVDEDTLVHMLDANPYEPCNKGCTNSSCLGRG